MRVFTSELEKVERCQSQVLTTLRRRAFFAQWLARCASNIREGIYRVLTRGNRREVFSPGALGEDVAWDEAWESLCARE
jgi:hypothetical protein